MSVGVAFGVFFVVLLLGGYLIVASGVWSELFGRLRDVRFLDDDADWADRPGEWIDRHEFWDLGPQDVEEEDATEDADVAFWRAG